ncbi:MAG: menaquinone reductase multiheme cytochrome c subunit QrcA [Desulfobacterales bacterium]
MSASEEKAKEVSEETAGKVGDTSSEQGNTGIVFIFFVIGLVVSLLVGWIAFPKVLYSQKQQPFDFNHKSHMEMVDNGCQSCHFFREDGTYSGAPKLEQCIECHYYVQGGSEDETIFVEQYVANSIEVPWLIYSEQPDCVYFSHAAHVISAEMDCRTCHGDIGESTSLPVYEYNVLTGYSRNIWGKNIAGFKKNTWDRMKMDDCSECHQKTNVNQNSVQTEKGPCFVCHK